ncbi:POTRA domain-containing protein, partial [Enterococcus faecium]|uniref:POTRA domain-containing protein n=1 Tax=Enterococcus faecium TaxID=1352 RepID=UPI0034E961EE
PQAQHRFSVGRIIIVGNTHTPERVILEKMTFCPGMEIGPSYLEAAEHNLARLFGIMDSCESPVVRPVVEVIDLESPSTVKDVLVTVEETCASRA